MRTVEEYHAAALDAIDRATNASTVTEKRDRAIREAAVYAELAKTADRVAEGDTAGPYPFLVMPSSCGKAGTLNIPGWNHIPGKTINVQCGFPPDHDSPCAFDRPPSPPRSEFAT